MLLNESQLAPVSTSRAELTCKWLVVRERCDLIFDRERTDVWQAVRQKFVIDILYSYIGDQILI